jgi:hypothetical protein
LAQSHKFGERLVYMVREGSSLLLIMSLYLESLSPSVWRFEMTGRNVFGSIRIFKDRGKEEWQGEKYKY